MRFLRSLLAIEEVYRAGSSPTATYTAAAAVENSESVVGAAVGRSLESKKVSTV